MLAGLLPAGLLPVAALAQTAGTAVVPPSSPLVASPPATPPAILPATPPVETNDWVPGKTVVIGVLDRVDGAIANLVVPVGGQATSGDMQISVLACVNRPADHVPDSAIFVSIQTTNDVSAPPLFRGWMVRSAPAVSVVGDASDTLRVVSCS